VTEGEYIVTAITTTREDHMRTTILMPTRTVELLIIDKGKPQNTPAE